MCVPPNLWRCKEVRYKTADLTFGDLEDALMTLQPVMPEEPIDLFVSGRLCLFGEHSGALRSR